MRALVLALSVLLCSGCFVSDELDKAVALIDQHGNKGKHKKANAEAEAEAEELAAAQKEGPGFFDEIVSWAEEQLEEPPPPPDPADFPVRCWIRGKEQFRTRWDCESRGGRAFELPSQE